MSFRTGGPPRVIALRFLRLAGLLREAELIQATVRDPGDPKRPIEIDLRRRRTTTRGGAKEGGGSIEWSAGEGKIDAGASKV